MGVLSRTGFGVRQEISKPGERIKSLLSEMEKDERLIYDELGGLLQDGYGLAQRLKTKHVTVPDVQKWIAEQITSLRARQASLKNLAREFIEKI